MRIRKIFCICFVVCLWISGFTTVFVDVWSSGPYAQINKVAGNDLEVISDIPYMEFEDYNINVWSPEEVYPTARLLYTYNGTLKVRVTDATPTSVIEELEREGFCGGEAVSGVTYYK